MKALIEFEAKQAAAQASQPATDKEAAIECAALTLDATGSG